MKNKFFIRALSLTASVLVLLPAICSCSKKEKPNFEIGMTAAQKEMIKITIDENTKIECKSDVKNDAKQNLPTEFPYYSVKTVEISDEEFDNYALFYGFDLQKAKKSKNTVGLPLLRGEKGENKSATLNMTGKGEIKYYTSFGYEGLSDASDEELIKKSAEYLKTIKNLVGRYEYRSFGYDPAEEKQNRFDFCRVLDDTGYENIRIVENEKVRFGYNKDGMCLNSFAIRNYKKLDDKKFVLSSFNSALKRITTPDWFSAENPEKLKAERLEVLSVRTVLMQIKSTVIPVFVFKGRAYSGEKSFDFISAVNPVEYTKN